MANSDFANLIKDQLHLGRTREADGHKVSAKGFHAYSGVSAATFSDWRTGKAAPRPFSTQIDDLVSYFELDATTGAPFHYAALEWWMATNRRQGKGSAAPSDSLRHALSTLADRFGTPSTRATALTAKAAVEGRSVVSGAPNVLRVLAELLRAELERPGLLVRLTFQTEPNVFIDYPDERREVRKWAAELRKRGTDFYSIWRPAINPLDLYYLPHLVLGLERSELEGKGRHVVCFPRAHAPGPSWLLQPYGGGPELPEPFVEPLHDIVITSNAALLIFTTEINREPDAALLIYDRRQIALIEQQFDRVVDKCTAVEPLALLPGQLQSYLKPPPRMNRIGYHKDVLALPHPEDGYPRSSRKEGPPDYLAAWLASGSANNEAFYESLRAGARFLDIVRLSALAEVTETAGGATLGGGQYVFLRDTATRFLENLIDLLKRYSEQYRLLLIPDDHATAPIFPGSNCVIHYDDTGEFRQLQEIMIWKGPEPPVEIAVVGPQSVLERSMDWLLAFEELAKDLPDPIALLEDYLRILRKGQGKRRRATQPKPAPWTS